MNLNSDRSEEQEESDKENDDDDVDEDDDGHVQEANLPSPNSRPHFPIGKF